MPSDRLVVHTYIDLEVSGEGAHTYRLPAMVVSPAGTLVVAYDVRYDGVDDLPARISVGVRRSTDRGHSWSECLLLHPPEGTVGVGEPSLIADRVTGRVGLFVVVAPSAVPASSMNTQAANGALRQMLVWSEDDGHSWSDFHDITPAVKRPEFFGVFATGGHGIQLHTGRLVQPFSYTTADLVPVIVTIYSDDHGNNWTLGEPIEAPGHRLEPESRVVELADGSDLLDIRPGSGEGRRFHARSHDGGVTFGPAVPTDLPDPSVNADIIQFAQTPGDGPSDVLLFSNPAHDARRENLVLRRSADGGRTWPERWTIHEGGAGYSVLADLGDGSVGLLFERDTERYLTYLHLSWTTRHHSVNA